MDASPESNEPDRGFDLGLALVVIGLLAIAWGVFHVLGAAYGPEGPPREFAQRRSYNMVKVDVHGAFVGGFIRAFSGLALCLLGAWLRRRRSASEA